MDNKLRGYVSSVEDVLRECFSSGEDVLVNTVIILNWRAILTDRQYWLDSTVQNLKMEKFTFVKISIRRRQGILLAPVDRYTIIIICMDKNWKIIQLIQPEILQVWRKQFLRLPLLLRLVICLNYPSYSKVKCSSQSQSHYREVTRSEIFMKII